MRHLLDFAQLKDLLRHVGAVFHPEDVFFVVGQTEDAWLGAKKATLAVLYEVEAAFEPRHVNLA